MNKLEFFGRIDGGVLKISNRRAFDLELSAIKDTDVEIVIKKRGRRSTQQNRYYWGVVVWMVRKRLDEMGYRYTADDVHSFLKDKFNGVDIANDDGEVIGRIGQSTTHMNKSEFAEYVDKISEWASMSLEIYIPPPGATEDLYIIK